MVGFRFKGSFKAGAQVVFRVTVRFGVGVKFRAEARVGCGLTPGFSTAPWPGLRRKVPVKPL